MVNTDKWLISLKNNVPIEPDGVLVLLRKDKWLIPLKNNVPIEPDGVLILLGKI
jgi:hypothetical protein